MKDKIKEINIPENVLVALGDLTNGALNYYKATETVKVRHNTILDYITNLQEIAEEHKNCSRKHWQQKCAEHCANEMIYKSRNEKAIELVKQNLMGIGYVEVSELLNILQGDDKSE